MKCILFTSQGTSEVRSIDRREVVAYFDLHTRDLRPVFSMRQLITISPKKKGIILNLGFLKMIIGPKDVWIFNADHPEVSQAFIGDLEKALASNEEKVCFEFLVLETALSQRFKKFRDDYDALEREVEKRLRGASKNFTDKALEQLLNLSKRLSQFETTISEMNQSLISILEDDEEMKLFFLSHKAQAKELEELESVLEFFSEPAEEMVHKIEDLKEHIDDTQAFWTLSFSNRRNTIIRFDLVATLVTTIFSFLAVITGIYGMNIRNNLEESFAGFTMIIVALFVLGLSTFVGLVWYLKRKGIL